MDKKENPTQDRLFEIIGLLVGKAMDEALNQIRSKVQKLIKEHGTEVLTDTPACEKWRKEHGENEEGCPGYLGCLKQKIIMDLLIQLGSNPPRGDNPIQLILWMNAVVDTVEIIMKILEIQSLEELRGSFKKLGIVEVKKAAGIEVG